MAVPIGIVIIIALKEEFDPIHAYLGLRKTDEIDQRLGNWYDCFIETIEGPSKHVFATFIGEMGPPAAIQFAARFLEHYTPSILINLGISGSLNDDVTLGDIVVASQADLYDDKGAIIDSSDGMTLKTSGRSIRADSFKEQVDHFGLDHQAKFEAWQAKCRKNFNELIEVTPNNISLDLLRHPTKVHTGAIACGNFVVKAEKWRNSILARDRKYLAVDMESAAIAFAAQGSVGSGRTRTLLIRAISDPADKRKDQLDKYGTSARGAFRTWAVRNGITFLEQFLKTLPADVLSNGESPRRASHDQLSLANILPSSVLNEYAVQGSKILEAYERFFNFFHRFGSQDGSFDSILNAVENHTQNATTIASISGYVGTGKSTFLACLFLRQSERFNSKLTEYVPIYVDLMRFVTRGTAHEASVALAQNLQRSLQSGNAKDAQHVMLIVDGCDEYYRHPNQSVLDEELKRCVVTLAESSKVVKVVGVGQSETVFLSERKSGTLSWATKDTLLCLERVSNPDIIIDAIDAYSRISTDGEWQQLSGKLSALIKTFNIVEVDLFILSLLNTAITRNWEITASGLASLYYEYCREYIKLDTNLSSLGGAEHRRVIRGIAHQVFETYVKRTSGEDKIDASASIITLIPHLHPSVKEFLIAEYVVDRITSEDINHNNLLDYIYTYGINRFVRSIINRSVDSQHQVFAAIKKLYLLAGLKQQAHLCYILGRFEDRTVRRDAIVLLRAFLKKGKKDPFSKGDIQDSGFREWLLLQRTIYISLIYLGDNSASVEYLELLLQRPAWDDLNRGFHLEYYEDVQTTPVAHHMIAPDDISVSPDKTFEVLHEKLTDDILHGKRKRAMTIIELHTLCSLCLVRHMAGKLNNDKRVRLLFLIQEILERRQVNIPHIYRAYLDMVSTSFEQQHCSVGGFVSGLLKLKKVHRSGWNTQRMAEGNNVVRTCPLPESVADHTYGCMIIAETLLPEHLPEPGFSKAEILRMLLIHDLAETSLGDIVTFKKTDDDNREENRMMQRISAHSALDALNGMRLWRQSWERFRKGHGINGQIASDIDAIECYMQLVTYNAQPECKIPDAEEWAQSIADGLATDIGKRIFDSLRHENVPLLQWH